MGNSSQRRLVAIPKHAPVISLDFHRAEQYLHFLATSSKQLGSQFELTELRGRRYRGLRGRLRRIAPQATATSIELLHAYRVSRDERTCHWITFTFPETVREANTSFTMDAIRQAILIDLSVDLGEVLIRPEHFTDWICELFENRDVDFKDHPVFSRKYFVRSADENHLRAHLPTSYMEVLEKHSDLVLRARGNLALLARDRKLKSTDTTLLVEVALELINAPQEL